MRDWEVITVPEHDSYTRLNVYVRKAGSKDMEVF